MAPVVLLEKLTDNGPQPEVTDGETEMTGGAETATVCVEVIVQPLAFVTVSVTV